MRRTAILAAAAACALAAAPAYADVEPNNAVFQPEGPIVAGVDTEGSVAPGDTEDWYVLYVDGRHQLHLTANASPGCATVRLADRDGRELAPDYTSPPGTTRFFVRVSHRWPCGTTSYSFRVDPPEALSTGPGVLSLRTPTEPNDTPADAFGPLSPTAWYFNRFETVNDHDWLRFFVRPGRRRVDVEFVVYGGNCVYEELELTGRRGALTEITRVASADPTIRHLTATSSAGQELLLAIRSLRPFGQPEPCVGSTTVVKVGPEDAILAGAELREACRDARRDARKGVARVRAAERRLARAGKPSPRALRRKLAGERRKLRSARRLAGVYCP